ncbi:MAG: DinB family protein, partial [Blastocatellia bacterium]
MNLNDIRQLLDYTEYANHLVLDAAEQLTEEQLRQDVKISMGSIFGTLVHMAAAEWIWLERWLGNSPAG